MESTTLKWYHWLWLWVIPTQSVTDKETRGNTERTTTMYYKKVGENIYIVDTKYSTRQVRRL